MDGGYVISDAFAQGGFATVHLGRRIAAGGFARTVAVKRLREPFAKDGELVAMLVDEARLVGGLTHPNVVATLDVVADDGQVLVVMEYVHGVSLRELASGPVPSPRVGATVLTHVLSGLHAAHEHKSKGISLGLVHRDVSPENVLVGSDGLARILDFGIAKAAGRLQATREGKIKGKLRYMAPEQLLGGSVTRAADVYSAGIVLWELCTGRRMFVAERPEDVMADVLEGNVPPPSTVAAGVSKELDAVVLRAVDPDPDRRYPTARDMARDLEERVGLAPPAEVAAWVEASAHTTLAERAQLVADLERASAPRTTGAMTTRVDGARARRVAWRARGAAVVAVALILGAGCAARAWTRAGSATPPSRPLLVSPAGGADETAASALPDPHAAEPRVSRPSRTLRTVTRPPARSRGGARCDPPYTVDQDLRVRYKKECF